MLSGNWTADPTIYEFSVHTMNSLFMQCHHLLLRWLIQNVPMCSCMDMADRNYITENALILNLESSDVHFAKNIFCIFFDFVDRPTDALPVQTTKN